MFDEQIRKYAKEIFIRNKQSEFTRLNLQSKGVAAIPQVGLFFIDELPEDGFKLYGKSCNLRDGELNEGIKSYPGNHCDIWKDMRDENPMWVKTKFLDVPRGRVVFDANNIRHPKFVVTLPVKYKDNQHLILTVLERYSLPAGRVRYLYEELY